MSALLADRHAPRTSLDSLLSAVEVASLRKWLAAEPAPGRVALVLGGPGSGVTTLLTLLVRELGMEPVWARAATPRLRAFLGDSGTSHTAVNGKRKVIVIDEYDVIVGDAAASVDVASFLKRKPAAPVVLLAHAVRSAKSTDAAGKAADRFVFQRPTWPVVARRLAAICESDGIDASAAQLEALARTVKGDVRGALAALDMYARRPCAAETIEVRDVSEEGLDVVDMLLAGPAVAVTEALRLYANDAAIVSNGLSENYTDAAADVETCARMADAFADADVMDEKIFARQAWDLLDVHAVFAVAAPVIELHRFGTARAAKKPAEKFGTVWSKMYNACAKQKNVRAIRTWRAEAGLSDAPAEDLALLRPAIQEAIARADPAEVRRLAAGVGGATEVLALMRLSKTEYKQTTHARLKKLLSVDGKPA